MNRNFFNVRHPARWLKLNLLWWLLLVVQVFGRGGVHHIFAKNIQPGDTIAYQGQPVICPGGSLLLTLANLPANSSIKWFNTGSSGSIGSAASYKVTNAGTYYAAVKYGDSSYTYPMLTVKAVDNPVASFTFTLQSNCLSAPVQFNNTSKGDGLTFLWNFGDPNAHKLNVSTDANPVHQFVGVPGNGSQPFVVTLMVTSPAGCSGFCSSNVTLLQSPDTNLGGPAAQTFDSKPYFVSCTGIPTEFTFVNNSQTTNTGYNIFWGDGSPQTYVTSFTSIKHVYRIGSFIMFYTVYGSNGCSKVEKYRIFVGTSPKISFQSAAPLSVCTNAAFIINVNNTANNTPGTTYTADFGDSAVNAYTTMPGYVLGNVVIGKWHDHTSYSVSGGNEKTKSDMYVFAVFIHDNCYYLVVTLPASHKPDKKNLFFDSISTE